MAADKGLEALAFLPEPTLQVDRRLGGEDWERKVLDGDGRVHVESKLEQRHTCTLGVALHAEAHWTCQHPLSMCLWPMRRLLESH